MTDSSLKELSVRSTPIWDEGLIALAEGMKHSSLTKLDVSLNNFGLQGISALASVLKDSDLLELNMSSTAMGDEGLLALSGGLQHSRLTAVDLSANTFSVNGIWELAEVIRTSDLTALKLSLTNDCLTGCADDARRVLLAGLRDSGVTTVGGSMVYPTDLKIAAVLRANKTRSFVLQLSVEASSTDFTCSFRTMGGSVAATLTWDADRPLKDLPAELLTALRRSGFKGLCVENLRIVRPDGNFLQVVSDAAPLAQQVRLKHHLQ